MSSRARKVHEVSPSPEAKAVCHVDYVLIVFLTAVTPVLAAIYSENSKLESEAQWITSREK